MTKLYKAVDKKAIQCGNKCWLVNELGVAVSFWHDCDDKEIMQNRQSEHLFYYDDISRFEINAINPVLMAEW